MYLSEFTSAVFLIRVHPCPSVVEPRFMGLWGWRRWGSIEGFGFQMQVELFRAAAPMFFEVPRQMCAVFVSQFQPRLLDGGAVLEQFNGLTVTAPLHPFLRREAHVLDEEPLQRTHGDAAVVGHFLDRPASLICLLLPVMDLMEVCVHQKRSPQYRLGRNHVVGHASRLSPT